MVTTAFPLSVRRRGHGWFAETIGGQSSLQLLDWWQEAHQPPAGFRCVRGEETPTDFARQERSIGVDQTNRSVIVGDAIVVKWTTGPLAGPHPGSDRLRRLLDAGFTRIPTLYGLVEWHTPDGYWVPAVSMQAYLPGAVDGWTWCLREARISLGIVSGSARPFAEALGLLAGQMHLALVDRTDHLVAVHGDFHVGQILRDPADELYVIDFDGNPTIEPTARLALQPAAYDVAGMLLSLENVGHVVRRYNPEVSDEAVIAWTDDVQTSFLSAYRTVADTLLDDALLPQMIDEQIMRELTYAQNHLPEWRYVPEAALRRRGR